MNKYGNHFTNIILVMCEWLAESESVRMYAMYENGIELFRSDFSEGIYFIFYTSKLTIKTNRIKQVSVDGY